MKDNSLLFLILSFGCFWLVLDEVYGSKLITQFVAMILPNTSLKDAILERAETERSYNTSSTDKNKDGQINTDDLRLDENGNYTDTTAGNMAGYKG